GTGASMQKAIDLAQPPAVPAELAPALKGIQHVLTDLQSLVTAVEANDAAAARKAGTALEADAAVLDKYDWTAAETATKALFQAHAAEQVAAGSAGDRAERGGTDRAGRAAYHNDRHRNDNQDGRHKEDQVVAAKQAEAGARVAGQSEPQPAADDRDLVVRPEGASSPNLGGLIGSDNQQGNGARCQDIATPGHRGHASGPVRNRLGL